MRQIVWGTIGSLFTGKHGKQAGGNLHVRKPHYADLDLSYGKRLTTNRIDELRKLALSHGTPETRLADGFHEDVFVATISDESQDRYGDRILVNGWMLEEYRKNPVLLFGHDYASIAVGHALDIYQDAVGASGETRSRLRGVFLWSRSNPEAQILKGVYEDGDMRAFSVGFIPESFLVPADDDERKELDLGPWGVLHERQTLLENSAVPVPANPNAITEEGIKEFRSAIPKEELPGLKKLAQRLHSVNLEVSKGLFEFFPSTKTSVNLSAENTPPTELDKGVVPTDVSKSKADEAEEWAVPTLGDFTEKTWEDSTEAEKRNIAGHYAWADASPASAYEQLSFPHHRAKDGAIVFKGVSAATEVIAKAEMPATDKAGVKKHLRTHYAEFEKAVPAELQSDEEELAAVLAWVKESHSALTFTLAEEAAEMKETPTEAVDAIFKMLTPQTPQQIKATLSPEGELEDTEPGGETHEPKPAITSAEEPPRTVPMDVSTEMAPREEKWEGLVEEDFPDFESLDDEGRTTVAGFFGWSVQMPPTAFDQLSYGHHRAEDGYVNFTGVQQAMDDLLGNIEGTPEEERRAVYDHLANHYEGFGETPPEFKAVEADTEPAKLTTPTPPAKGGSDIESAKLKAEILAELRGELATEDPDEPKWRVVRAHKPEMAPEGTTMTRADWDKAVGDDFKMRRQTSLIYNASDVKNPKTYLMPHHLAEEGTPVVFDAVRRAMRTLLGKSIEGKIPESVRRRAYFHLRTHYEQFEKEAPAFRSVEQLAALGKFLTETANGIIDGLPGAETALDFVFMGYQSTNEDAYEIQALNFETNHWEKADAEAFARQNGFDVSKFVTPTAGVIAFEQRAPGDFVALRAKRLSDEPETNGVQVLGGRLKTQAGILSERLTKVENAITDGIAKVMAFKSELVGLLTEGARKGNNSKLIRELTELRSTDNFGAILEQTTKALEIAEEKLKPKP